MGNEVEIIGKITIKNIVGDIKELCKDIIGKPEASKELCKIIGIVNKFSLKQTDLGESVCLHGQFKAISCISGYSAQAGKAFLPDLVNDLIIPHLKTGDNEQNELAFAILVSVKGHKTSATGYVYAIKPLLEVAKNEPLSLLEQKIS